MPVVQTDGHIASFKVNAPEPPNDQCPFYAKGDEFKLSGNALLLELKQEKTFISTAIVTPPYEKETCRTLIGDLTRILTEFESVDRIPEDVLACSGCSGVIKLEPCLRHRANGTAGAKDRSRNIDAVAGMVVNGLVDSTELKEF